MIRRTGTLLLLGLLAWGGAVYPSTGNLNASEPGMTDSGIAPQTVAVNVAHLVKGKDYKGVLEISRSGITHVSEYTVWVRSVPWNQILEWRCFGSKHADSNEEDPCTLWIQLEKGSSRNERHLFFKVPCEIVPGQENWETLESYDYRDNL